MLDVAGQNTLCHRLQSGSPGLEFRGPFLLVVHITVVGFFGDNAVRPVAAHMNFQVVGAFDLGQHHPVDRRRLAGRQGVYRQLRLGQGIAVKGFAIDRAGFVIDYQTLVADAIDAIHPQL